jgi:hypothetical protein
MTASQPTPSDDGFIHVRCNACGNPDVWLKCEKCAKSDHFRLEGAGVRCACGASYGHATCLCGERVPPAGKLEFVAWDQGPKALADLEIAWGRVAGLAILALAAVAGLAWALTR